MARKLYKFPLFDIIEIYKEFKEKDITPFKWVTEEIEKTFPEEIIKELKPIRRKLLPLPEEELPPSEEKEITISIIPDKLPYIIDSDETYDNFIDAIRSLEDENLNSNETDTERKLQFIEHVELYYKDENIIMIENKPTTYNVDVPIIEKRKNWLIKTIKALYKTIVRGVIKRYKQQGIKYSPGNNEGSLDWRLIVEKDMNYYIKYMR